MRNMFPGDFETIRHEQCGQSLGWEGRFLHCMKIRLPFPLARRSPENRRHLLRWLKSKGGCAGYRFASGGGQFMSVWRPQ